VVQVTNYYLSGLLWATSPEQNADLQPYKFNGCEFIEMGGLDITDLGNRGIYHAISRFTTMDRFCEKVPWQSPYVFAGNNPVRFVDVRGDSIVPESQKAFDKEKNRITTKRDNLEKNNKNGKNDGRIQRLNNTLNTMGRMETSEQWYALNKVGEKTTSNVSLNTTTSVITIDYSGTATFVHETTHIQQLMDGQIAFDTDGNKLLNDATDEIEAYKNQFSYDPSSVSTINPHITVKGFDDMTVRWLRGVVDANGTQLYRRLPETSIDINSTRDQLFNADPRLRYLYQNHLPTPQSTMRDWPYSSLYIIR